MSRIISVYENNVERTWYNSSNIFYSECDDGDKIEKTVRITFNDGRTYEYEDVNVYDYLLFRNAESQGKVFHKFMKEYKVQKLENQNIETLQNELEERQHTHHKSDDNDESEFSIIISDNKLHITQKTEHIKTISLEEKNIVGIIKNLCAVLKIKVIENGSD